SLLLLVLATLLGAGSTTASTTVLDSRLHHLRVDGEREWSDFPPQAEASRLVLRFQAEHNATERALRLRQQDVKQAWKVLLNGKELGLLQADENDAIIYFRIPAGWLVSGENRLVVQPASRIPDDIRVGRIALAAHPVSEVLPE